jgi:DNA replication and repair protein RecF
MLALKLAQFDFLKELTQLPPLLLLDDIFDKLDRNRVNHLVEMVAEEHFGQIFITDTSRDRIENILPGKNFDYFIYQVENGKAWK